MNIVERIKKLYNLSTRNDNTHQAAAAAAKIQELCFAHELDLQKIIAQGTDPVDPYVKTDFILPEASNTDIGWKKSLFHSVCKSNFCQSVYFLKTFRLAVIGQKHCYETAVYSYEYLSGEIIRLAVDNSIRQAFIQSKDRRKYIQSFCEGATAEVYRTLMAAMNRQAQGASDSRALVVVKDAELKKAVSVHFPDGLTSRKRRGSVGSNSGYSDGRRAGASISVNRGVGGSSRTALN